jgi:hypothetical protein
MRLPSFSILHSPLTLLLLLLCTFATAQNATISGVITALPANEPVPFAPIVIQGTTTGAVSDIDGKYAITGLAPGLYNLECSAVGYKKAIIFEVEVTKDRSALVNIQLEELATEIGPVEISSTRRTNEDESPISVRSTPHQRR